MGSWIQPICLGLGLASASGLNTFLPLALLAGVAHTHLIDIHLNPAYAWIGSNTALTALSIATGVEILADKIPGVDHLLDVVGTVARPLAGAIAAGAVLSTGDPTTAALVGLILGGPTAFGMHAAKAGTRAAATMTMAGLASPILSVSEDLLATLLCALGFFAPWGAPLLIGILAYAAWRLISKFRRPGPARHAATSGS